MKKIKSKKTIRRVSKPKKTQINWLMILGILAVIFSLKLIFSGYARLSNSNKIGINQVGVASGRVALTFNPSTVTVEPNTETTLTLSIDAGTDYATIAQIELNYDPAKIGTPTITQGDFFASSMATTVVQNGKITFSYSSGVPAEGQRAGKTGSGTLAIIKFTPTVAGTSTLSFSDASLVYVIDGTSQEDIPSNMLKSATDVSIQVGSAQASTAASASPSSAASAQASASPSSAASAQASASPSTSTFKPSTPTNLRFNCYDNGGKVTLRWDSVTGAGDYLAYLDDPSSSQDFSQTTSGKEVDVSIKANTKYIWSLKARKDGVSSDEAKVSDITCASTAATPAPTSTPTATPRSTIKATPKPTVKPTAKATATPKSNTTSVATPTPASTSTTSIFSSPTSNGSLNDIYGEEPTPETTESSTKPGLLAQIFLGWKALILAIIDGISN